MEKKVEISWLHSDSPVAKVLVNHWATEEDRARARGRTASGAFLSILTWAAVRALLAKNTGATRWIFARNPSGKPFARLVSGEPGPSFSCAHGGTMVAVAVGEVGTLLGVDIEPHRPRDFRALARAAFGPNEQYQVELGKVPSFYRLWTLREAIGKATGEGLSLAADGRDRIGPGPELGCWRSAEWQLAHLEPESGFSLAVALHGADAMQLQRVDLDEFS